MKYFLSSKLLFSILVLLITSNCASHRTFHVYDGPHFSKDKVGIIWMNSSIIVKEIDGRKLREIMDATGFKSKAEIPEADHLQIGNYRFLPGEHTIRVVFAPTRILPGEFFSGGQGRVEIMGEWLLKFLVEPGHDYRFDYRSQKKVDSAEYEADVVLYESDSNARNLTGKIVSEVIEKK